MSLKDTMWSICVSVWQNGGWQQQAITTMDGCNDERVLKAERPITTNATSASLDYCFN